MTTENNILKELTELEQFLADIKKLENAWQGLRANLAYMKYYKLYTECNFAISVLLWKIEDDINFLGSIQKKVLEKDHQVSIDHKISSKLDEIVAKIDALIEEAELQNIEAYDVIGWCISYNREEYRSNLKLLYETP